MLTNLLDETTQALRNHHLSFKNVRGIINMEGYIPIAEFTAAAASLNYDSGYGTVVIDPTLKIIGATWWMERGNYDGYEGWIFLKKPQIPTLKANSFSLTEDRGFNDGDIMSRLESKK